jgi:hypothetical protein
VCPKLLGHFLQGHFLIIRTRHFPGPDRPLRAMPVPLQQASDHRGVEGAALGGPKALRVQAGGNLLGRGGSRQPEYDCIAMC